MSKKEYKKITNRVHREESQSGRILKHMQEGYGITPITALNKYGCFRLAAVVFDLKKEGHNIRTTIIKENNKKFARYKLTQGV
jgi:hypothetical protein|tara:strand:+ start:965 stop:1213 length:249 start_codon:yes stop_codon:yes gene_type:complete